MRKSKLAKEAVREFSTSDQISMLVEECAELIAVINHHKRGRVGIDAVRRELADVEIMLEQAKIIFGDWSNELDWKLDRLEFTLKERTND
jgi:NTP pyrophosphatase (non-canonical NTP hydrolase)